MIDLSVVIVTWNSGDLLRRCVESLRGFYRTLSVELIVVDNASSDGSASFPLWNRDSTRLVVNPENGGFARACNQGIRASTGRYILLLNPDTEVLPGALEALVAFMDTHPEAGAAGPGLVNPDGSLQPSGGRFPSLRRLLAIHPVIGRFLPAPEDPLRRRDFSEVSEVDEVSGACMIVRRAAVHEVGLRDEVFFLYFEDVDWCLRLKRAGWRIYYLPQARVKHLWRSRTNPSPNAQVHHLRSLLYYMRKHFGLGPSLLLTALYIGVYGGLLAKAMLRRLLEPAPPHGHDLRCYWQLLRVCLGG